MRELLKMGKSLLLALPCRFAALALAIGLASTAWAASTYSTYSNDTDTPSAGDAFTTGQAFQLKATWMFKTSGDDIASSAAAVKVDSIAVKWASSTHGNADIGHNKGGAQPDAYLVVTTPQDVIVGISSVNDTKWVANGTSTFAFTDLVIASNAQYIYYFATDVSGLTVGGGLPTEKKKYGRILGAWHGSAPTSDTIVHINAHNAYSINSIFTVSSATVTALTTSSEAVSLSTDSNPVVVTGAVANGVVNVGSGANVPSLTVVGQATTLKLADSLTATYLYLPATTTIDATGVAFALPSGDENAKETKILTGKVSSGSDPTVTLPTLEEGYSFEPIVRDDSGITVIVSKPVDANITLVAGESIYWSQVKPEGWMNSGVPVINVDNTVAGTLVFDEDVQAAKIHITKGAAVDFVRGDSVNINIPYFTAVMTYMRVTFTNFESVPQTGHATDANDQITVSGSSTLTSFPQINTANQSAVLVVNQTANLSDSGFYVTGTKTVNINSGANVTATRFVIGNNGSVTQTVTQNGGTVTVTGNAAPTSNQASILLGHWNSTATLKTLGGTFTANNAASRLGWDGTATWQIGGGDSQAQVNVRGIVNGANGHAGAGTLNIMANGSLNLGEDGINFASSSNGGNINLAGGTINASAASVTIINAKDSGTIISQNNTTTANVESGKTLTINAVLSGTVGGTLEKTGSGSLVLAKSATTNGKLLVSAGKVQFNAGINWGSNGSVEVGENGTLDVLTSETVAAGELLVAGTFTVNGSIQNNGTAVDVEVKSDGIYIAIPKVTINVPSVLNTTVTVTVGGETVAANQDGTYSVPAGAEVTVTYAAAEGYEMTGTATYTIASATQDATVVPDITTAQYVAQIVGGSSYTSLQMAFNALTGRTGKLVLLANTAQGATIPSVSGLAFYFCPGEFTYGEIANASGNFVTTAQNTTIEIDDVEVSAIKYSVDVAFMAVTIDGNRVLYSQASANDAITSANAGPIGTTTVEFFSGDPATYASYLPMFDYNSETGVYTKVADPVAAIYSGITQLSVYRTLVAAFAAAEDGNRVMLFADSSEAITFSDKSVVFDEGDYTFSGSFSGSGTLVLTAPWKNNNNRISAQWTGMVVLPALSYMGDYNFNMYGNSSSVVRVQGIEAGWMNVTELGNPNKSRQQTTLEIEGAYSVTAMSSWDYIFDKVTGTGSMSFATGETQPNSIIIGEMVGTGVSIVNSTTRNISITKLVLETEPTVGDLVLNSSTPGKISIGSVYVGNTQLEVTITDGANGKYIASIGVPDTDGQDAGSISKDGDDIVAALNTTGATVELPAEVTKLTLTVTDGKSPANITAAGVAIDDVVVKYGTVETTGAYAITKNGNVISFNIKTDASSVIVGEETISVTPALDTTVASPFTLGANAGFNTKTIPGLYYAVNYGTDPTFTTKSTTKPEQAKSTNTPLTAPMDGNVQFYQIAVGVTADDLTPAE